MTQALPLQLTPSAIADFRACEYRYARTHLQRLAPHELEPVSLLVFGDVVHKCVADFFRRGGWGRVGMNHLLASLNRHWRGEIYDGPDLDEANYQRAVEMLRTFHGAGPYPAQVAQELGIEKKMAWTRQRGGLLVLGRIDRLCRLPDDTIEVIDFKTGKRNKDGDALLSDAQAAIYHSLVADAFKFPAPSRIRVTFYYLPSGVPVSVVFDREAYDEVWEEIMATAEAIRRAFKRVIAGDPVVEAFPQRRGDRCFKCPLRRHCGAATHAPITAQVQEGEM